MRLTVGRMLVLVAAVGVTLGSARLHLAWGIFVACVAFLTFGRTFSVLDRLLLGDPVTTRRIVGLWFESLCFAVAILVPSIAIGISLFSLLGLSTFHSGHGYPVDWWALGVALPAAAWACSAIRRRLWPYRPAPGDQPEAEPAEEPIEVQ